jgi:hypothetical protein
MPSPIQRDGTDYHPACGVPQDLKAGAGAEYVDRSAVVLVFASNGYFDRPNCL